VACDRDAQAPGFEYADKRAIVSAEDEPAIGKLAEAEGIDGVIAPGIDWPVAIAARVAARFGLPHPLAPETASLAVSKQRHASGCRGGSPAARVADHDRGGGAARSLWSSCRTARGQKGLTLVRDASELEAAVELAMAEPAPCAPSRSRRRPRR
jgi:hypothetical protein